MVPGIDSFREKFKDYTDYYTIIGGTACDILLSEADLPFRATKDIDDDTSSLSAITEDVAQMFQAIIEDRNAPKVEKTIDGYSGFLFYDDNGMPLVAMH